MLRKQQQKEAINNEQKKPYQKLLSQNNHFQSSTGKKAFYITLEGKEKIQSIFFST